MFLEKKDYLIRMKYRFKKKNNEKVKSWYNTKNFNPYS